MIHSKRTGLEKAIYQVEQAIKRSKRNDITLDADPEVDLKQLVDQSHKLAHQNGSERTPSLGGNSIRAESVVRRTSHPYSEAMAASLPREATVPEHAEKPDVLALDNAEGMCWALKELVTGR